MKDRPKDMIFLDLRREEYWKDVDKIMEQIKDKKVLDVCCGYGRFSSFDKYTGIDFSGEMIELAKKKHPNKDFREVPAMTEMEDTYDVVYEVNSLHSMGVTADEFFEFYRQYATEYVMCLERRCFYIYKIYERNPDSN